MSDAEGRPVCKPMCGSRCDGKGRCHHVYETEWLTYCNGEEGAHPMFCSLDCCIAGRPLHLSAPRCFDCNAERPLRGSPPTCEECIAKMEPVHAPRAAVDIRWSTCKCGRDTPDPGGVCRSCSAPAPSQGATAEAAAPGKPTRVEVGRPYYLIERNDLSRAAWWGKDGRGCWTVDVHSAHRYATAAEAQRECSALLKVTEHRLKVTEHLDMPAAPAAEGEPPARQCDAAECTLSEPHQECPEPTPAPPPEMTFAEAMALDPKSVEVLDPVDGKWKTVAAVQGGFALDWFSAATRRFRLAPRPAPVLTRVRILAEEFAAGTDRISMNCYVAFGERVATAFGTRLLQLIDGPAVDTLKRALEQAEREFLGPKGVR